jgi:hypothetical protein
MCARLGGCASMLGMVGNDENGRAYIENFKVESSGDLICPYLFTACILGEQCER